jgi:hypothetical protein
MPDILVHALIAYIICPGLVYFAVRTMNKYSDIRNPKVWWAVASGVYGMLAVIMGLVQGGRAGTDVGLLLELSDPWIVVLLGMALSLGLCFWMLLVAENRFFARSSEILE